jgi:hypothetical protein
VIPSAFCDALQWKLRDPNEAIAGGACHSVSVWGHGSVVHLTKSAELQPLNDAEHLGRLNEGSKIAFPQTRGDSILAKPNPLDCIPA